MTAPEDDRALEMVRAHAMDIDRAYRAALADGASPSDLVAFVVDGTAFDPVREDAVWITRRARLRDKLNAVLSQSRFSWASIRDDDELLSEVLAPPPPGYVMRVFTATMIGDSLSMSAIATMKNSPHGFS